ncbi:retrovirus-related Pol polyprotein from transposon opus [Elysia marginata]|uniref:Retrovirus-related Pol polyprotein from transposon opus n=1 Tax=Elysia marginata TaxID=1093978 RepID=A0AAV4IJZ4_9GAST|nr:retrovirus-related Pol polyprotein from transposon opus [Elysia marginata]
MLKDSDDQVVKTVQPSIKTGRKWKKAEAIDEAKECLMIKEIYVTLHNMAEFNQELDSCMPAGETPVRRHTSLPLPKQFDGTSELWPRWRARFQRFRLCSGLSEKPDSKQVGTLLYSMGDIADDILAMIKLDESRTTYQETLVALDAYFNSNKNTIFARARFNRRVQQPGESVKDSFIHDLHKLADECSYLTVKDELIRDRIVVGVRDDDLSKVLQGKQDLDLSEAIRLSRQAEARTEGQNLLRPRVDLVQRAFVPPKTTKKFLHPPKKQFPRFGTDKKCDNCGRTPFHKKSHARQNLQCATAVTRRATIALSVAPPRSGPSI